MVASIQNAFSWKASLLQIHAMDQLNNKRNKGLWHSVPQNLHSTSLGPPWARKRAMSFECKQPRRLWRRAECTLNTCHFEHGDALGHHFLNGMSDPWTFLMQRQGRAEDLSGPQMATQDIQNKNQDYIEYYEITIGHFSNKVMGYFL